ncbi:transporter substrate-binding domain-containing protein [Pseudodesulfovibrio thermohalotolerans]|uniref:substrate-binding periplasmic protein n=1 Tax=Pseudodesulfovibrio thermohalotolerans TaxID=2880651 RepID=UPI002442F710|nr:transporter substrate-binding domain-containing protein [Pseudodesulfovibrio thermohalotolerans]WFS62194.1 transporter substrate-binding domain-containing protein [Pseudodesulfovibrio thermohalotolerans]
MKRLFIPLIFLLLLGPDPVAASDLLVITESNPPFTFNETGGPAGIATDLFLLMAKRAGLDVKRSDIKFWPWARGYQEIREKPNVILFATARTGEREAQFRWIGPIATLRSGLIALKSRRLVITDPVWGAWRYRYGTIRSSASEQELTSQGVPPAWMERVHDRVLNIRKLVNGHIDVLVGNETNTYHTIRRLGLDPNDFEMVYQLMTTDLYYAASLDMDPDVVNRLQTALDSLKADGTAARIAVQYR